MVERNDSHRPICVYTIINSFNPNNDFAEAKYLVNT